MTIPPVVVRLLADTKGLEDGLRSARNMTAGFAAAAGVAIAGATASFVALTRSSMQTIDAQAKLARAVGGTTAAMQALERAGDRSGVQQSEMAAAVTRLNQRLGEVIATGKGADDTFKAMGLTAQQLASMDIDERFMAISDAMRRAGMSTQEMSYHLRQLGIRQSSVITLLQSGSEEISRSRDAINALGVAVSEVDAAQIERTNDALSEVGRVFEGIGNRLATQVAPHLERFADQFVALAQVGGPISEAIDRVVDAAGRLMDVLAQESTVQAFSNALVNIIGVVSDVADGIVWMTQNVEILTGALGLLAAAVLAAGGPLSWVIGLAAAAASAFVTLRSRTNDLEGAVTTAEAAETALNQALSDFATAHGPNANAQSRARVVALRDQTRQALETAKAELALMQVERQARLERAETHRGRLGGVQRLNVLEDDIAASTEEARKLEIALLDIEKTLRDMRDSEVPNPIPLVPELLPPRVPTKPGDDRGAKSTQDAFATRLEALVTGLQTEREVVDAWYLEGQAILDDRRAQELLGQEEYNEARLRLDEEYARRSLSIEQALQDQKRSAIFGAADDILGGLGNFFSGALKAQKVFSAASALMNAYTGASQALADPTLPTWAKFAAAAKVVSTGLGFVAAIKGGNSSGSSLGSRGGGGGASTPATPARPQEPLNVRLQGFGPSDLYSGSMIGELLNRLSEEAGDRGYRIMVAQ